MTMGRSIRNGMRVSDGIRKGLRAPDVPWRSGSDAQLPHQSVVTNARPEQPWTKRQSARLVLEEIGPWSQEEGGPN